MPVGACPRGAVPVSVSEVFPGAAVIWRVVPVPAVVARAIKRTLFANNKCFAVVVCAVVAVALPYRLMFRRRSASKTLINGSGDMF